MRGYLYIPFTVVWSIVVLTLCTLSGILTLGLINHRLVNLWAPMWGRAILMFAGIKLEIYGREHVEGYRPRVVVMNHASMLDMLVMAAVNPPGLTALAKNQFKYIPLVGQAMWAMGLVFVKRDNPVRARKSVHLLGQRMRRRPRSVIIAPEGTRSRTGVLQPFKIGAFFLAQQAAVPIVPAVIYGAYELNPPNSWAIKPGLVVLVFHSERATDDWDFDELRSQASALREDYVLWLEEGPPH